MSEQARPRQDRQVCGFPLRAPRRAPGSGPCSMARGDGENAVRCLNSGKTNDRCVRREGRRPL